MDGIEGYQHAGSQLGSQPDYADASHYNVSSRYPQPYHANSLALNTRDLHSQDHTMMSSSPLSGGPFPDTSHLSPDWQARCQVNSNPHAGPWTPLGHGPERSYPMLPGPPSLTSYRQNLSWDMGSRDGLPRSDSGYGASMYKTISTLSAPGVLNNADTQSISVSSSFHGRSKRRKITPAQGGQVRRRSSSQSTRSSQVLPACQQCALKGIYKVPKNKAEQNKHELTHTRPFQCEHSECQKNPRFATRNDLDRHQSSCHGITAQTGNHYYYKCEYHPCPKKDKLWDRKDNFKQHVQRIHKQIPPNHVDELVTRSRYKPSEEELNAHHCAKKTTSKHNHRDDVSMYSDRTKEEATNTERHFSNASQLDHMDMGYGQEIEENPMQLPSLSSHGQLNACPGDMYLSDLRGIDTAAEACGQNYQASAPDLGFAGLSTDDNSHHFAYSQNFSEQNINADYSMTSADSSYSSVYYHRQPADTDVMSFEDYNCLEPDPFVREDDQSPVSVSGHHVAVAGEQGFKCKDCPKFKARLCDLNKHMKRHTKPFGCTFPKCAKRFGSKNDWKRHENSQHVHQDLWRCDLGACAEAKPARLFYDDGWFAKHLAHEHDLSMGSAEAAVHIRRLHIGKGGNGRGRFWCGFCNRIVSGSRERGFMGLGGIAGDDDGDDDGDGKSQLMLSLAEGHNERLKHVGDHFDRDKSSFEWVCVEMNKEKRYLWEKTGKQQERGMPDFS